MSDPVQEQPMNRMHVFRLWHQGPPYEAWGVQEFDPHSGGSSTKTFGNDLLATLDHFADLLLGPRCAECRGLIHFGYMASVQARMREQSVCITCLNWRDHAKAFGPHVAIVDGEHFIIRPDAPRGYQGFIGHGGAEFRIAFHDGRRVVTRNLWAQGRVPDHFRDRLPNNARFLKVGEYTGYRGAGTAHAHDKANQAHTS